MGEGHLTSFQRFCDPTELTYLTFTLFSLGESLGQMSSGQTLCTFTFEVKSGGSKSLVDSVSIIQWGPEVFLGLW